MDANEWLNSLPEQAGEERNKMTLDAIASGLIKLDFVPIISKIEEHEATFYIVSDAGYVELEDGSRFRPQVTAKMNQQAADLVDASMVTAKIMDMRHKQAQVILDAQALPAGPQMSTTSYSKKYNSLVEEKRAGREGLVSDCGKAWILDNALAHSTGAVNYGFFAKGAPYVSQGGLKLWQTIGLGIISSDSQCLFLMKKNCILDGNDTDITSILSDPKFATLADYGGVLHYLRQPF